MIALDRGYHGSSSTGAGLTGLPVFHANFDVPTPRQHHIPCPYPYRSDDASDGAIIAASVADLKAKVADLGQDNVAAFFVEPVIGSGGVIVTQAGWLTARTQNGRDRDIRFAGDEVCKSEREHV